MTEGYLGYPPPHIMAVIEASLKKPTDSINSYTTFKYVDKLSFSYSSDDEIHVELDELDPSGNPISWDGSNWEWSYQPE